MDEFDAAEVFNDDFVYFYADRISPSRTKSEHELLKSIARFVPGETVLDLCCGEGRITNSFAAEELRVVGLDISFGYLQRAQSNATTLSSDVHFINGDQRNLPIREAIDLLICWYTSFGYFNDDANRKLLDEMFFSIRPGGRVLLDIDSKEHLLRSGLPTQMRERGDDVMVERFRFDGRTSRIEVLRTVVRDGILRRSSYFVRVFGEEEIREWLVDAGFRDISLFGEDSLSFGSSSRRMIARAFRP